MAGITLTLTIGDGDRAEELFVSRKPWLHPLFDLSGYLGSCPYSPSELVLYDTVTGRASALLVACIGIKTLVTGVISAGGEEICALYGITYRARKHIPAIGCATETLLSDEYDCQRAYRVLRTRAAGAAAQESRGE